MVENCQVKYIYIIYLYKCVYCICYTSYTFGILTYWNCLLWKRWRKKKRSTYFNIFEAGKYLNMLHEFNKLSLYDDNDEDDDKMSSVGNDNNTLKYYSSLFNKIKIRCSLQIFVLKNFLHFFSIYYLTVDGDTRLNW